MNKKIFLAGLLCLASVASVVGTVGNAHNVEAWDVAANTYIYFELPSTWDSSKEVNFIIGHNSWSQGYKMTKITNTDIYYVKMASWGGYNDYAFMSVTGTWGGEGKKINDRIGYSLNHTSIYSPSSDNDWYIKSGYHMFGGDAVNPNPTRVTETNGYKKLNIKMTAEINDVNAGTVKVSGYKLTSATAVTAQDLSDTEILKYTDATFTATVNEGYTFDGWYTSATGGELKSSELSFTVTNVYEAHTYYARYTAIPTTTPSDEVNTLFSTYYNDGSYTKYSVLNTNEMADAEVKKYFHAGADTKYRKTVYTPDGLKMTTSNTEDGEYTNESVYANGNNCVNHTGFGGNWTVNEYSSVEDWFVTLKDFVDASTTDWTYENGAYSHELVSATATSEDDLTRMAREFVAPMWLAPNANNWNYVTFTKLTVEEVDNTLVMKLYVHEQDSTKLEPESNNVFSKVTIYK